MAASTTSDVSDGPVLNFINKRLRALRKKLNRITTMEEGIAQGKPINKEQEETLRSKPSIVAAIDELEKLKQPLSVAVNEEVALAIERREADKVNQTLGNDEKEESEEQQEEEASKVEEVVVVDDKALFVEDLLNLIYFGSMFDVKSQSDFNSIMLTRAHERECCLAYDYVTDDDSNEMLGERDLDLISAMGSLLISRPGASSLSHQNALQRCIEHAKLWLEKSDQPIDVNSSVTYAGLREKLTKIMGSNYFTITPEMKAPVDVAAASAGNYASFQVPAQVDGSVAQYEQKEDGVVAYQESETYDEQSSPAEEQHKDEYDAENYVETSAAQAAGSEKSHSEAGVEYRDQQQASRRLYQNQRGGGGRSSGGAGGGRRGYSNGGGGRSGGGRRGGGGPYQNGRNQYYDQPGGYHQRSYYNNRGRGGRGPVGNSYNPSAAAAGVNVGES